MVVIDKEAGNKWHWDKFYELLTRAIEIHNNSIDDEKLRIKLTKTFIKR